MIQFIGIAGGSASGKSRFSKELSQRLRTPNVIIPIDAYYRCRGDLSLEQRTSIDYDHPDAIDWDALAETLDRLRQGQAAQRPIYRFETHSRDGFLTLPKNSRIYIIEGLWTFQSALVRPFLRLKVFIESSLSLRRERRIDRDVRERGRSQASVARVFDTQVEPAHQRFVEPQKKNADLVVPSPWRTDDLDRIASILLEESGP